MNATAPAWETVHFISNNYDGPLEGLADVDAVAHVFFLHDEIVRQVPVQPASADRGAAIDPDLEDEVDYEVDRIFALHPASEELVAALMEQHEIFESWHRAYTADRSLQDQHPALPADRTRYQDLKVKTSSQLEAMRVATPPVLKMGTFESGRRPVAPGSSRWQSFEVQWVEPVGSDEPASP